MRSSVGVIYEQKAREIFEGKEDLLPDPQVTENEPLLSFRSEGLDEFVVDGLHIKLCHGQIRQIQ